MHQALYRKWRPKTFDEVVGQEHVTSILKEEAVVGKFSHAYLFCGSRGTGKTTCAKILAKVVNCENPINGNPCLKCESCLSIEHGTNTDVLEMDAASNNGVDNVRDIRDEVNYTPSMLKYRVYIVDEVHMLSQSAFNALLKTLEEPPSHVIFILATTELQKLPATIISRCQRFEFRRIASSVLSDRIKFIAKEEGIGLEDSASKLIARYARGGMRDSISLMELCASADKNITVETVNEMIGSTGKETVIKVLKSISNKDFDSIFEIVDEIENSSKDISVFWQEITATTRDILIVKTIKEYGKFLDLTDSEIDELKSVSELFTKENLLYFIKVFEETLFEMQKNTTLKRVLAETALLKLTDESLSTSNEALLSRISKLENGVVYSVPKAEKISAKEEKKETKQEIKVERQTKTKVETVSNDTKKVYKALKCWQEAIFSVQTLDSAVYSFLKKTRAYQKEDGKIYAEANAFSLNILAQNTKVKECIANSLSKLLQNNITADDIIFEMQDKNSEIVEDDFDDILKEI